MKKITTLLLIFCFSKIAFSQTPQVLFYGYIEQGILEENEEVTKKSKGPAKLRDTKLFVYSQDSLIQIINSRETGFYAALLNEGQVYKLVFEKEGYFCKCFEIDCRNIEFADTDVAIKCLVDVTLFPKIEDSDLLNLCKIPYAKASFNEETQEIVWDMAYTEKVKSKFLALAQPYYTAMTQ